MAWTTPAPGAVIPSTNEKILYDATNSITQGVATDSSVATYNAVASFTERNSPVVCDITTANDNGTVQLRVYTQYNLTAIGACTSLTLTAYLGVLMSATTGSIGSNVSLISATALTGGTLTTGWKTYDSGWRDISALATDLTAYGHLVGTPVYRFDTVGGNPTIGRIGMTVQMRIS